ncbi:MAG: hypothetical protein M1832_005190 [Thelocarpon impressellum]|nr:MAG: hypothetical protein M1832_005190 [Thelocarpon impressellum]
MSSPPHPLMHFGMTAWIKLSNEETGYYKGGKDSGEWPPKYWKFVLETEGEPSIKAAFVDSRRFGRIRLIDCDKDEIRRVLPLSENGPDPVQDKELVTLEWLMEKVRSKKVPVKAFLLNQANISGVGNWVGDEILYHAKIHPEQYTDSLNDAQLEQLHKSLLNVCSIACETLADSDKFPKDWLMKYRWGKGKKDNKLPNGSKIIYLTVGGRTSAVVPSVQKKTGPVAGDLSPKAGEDEEEKDGGLEEVEDKVSKQSQKKKRAAKATETATAPVQAKSEALPDHQSSKVKREDTHEDTAPPASTKSPSKRKAVGEVNGEATQEESKSKKAKKVPELEANTKEAKPARRQSARVSGRTLE